MSGHRPAAPLDEPSMTDLLANINAHASEVSPPGPGSFNLLAGEASLARGIGHADAFLLAFDQDANYARGLRQPELYMVSLPLCTLVYVDRTRGRTAGTRA